MFKFEFKRAINSRNFKVMILIGIVVTVMHICVDLLPRHEINIRSNMNSPLRLWMGLDWSYIYQIWIMIMPLVATITYGDSYFQDKDSGFTDIVYTKDDKKKYFNAKFIVNFITGGIIFTFPLILDLYILVMMYPSIYPDIANSELVYFSLFPYLYVNKTYLYIWLYIFIQFLFAGAFATFGLAISTVVKKKFVALVAPFALLLLNMFIGEFFIGNNTIITAIIQAYPVVRHTKLSYICIEFLLLFISSIIMYYIGVRKDEYNR